MTQDRDTFSSFLSKPYILLQDYGGRPDLTWYSDFLENISLTLSRVNPDKHDGKHECLKSLTGLRYYKDNRK